MLVKCWWVLGLRKHNNTIQNVDGTAPGPEEGVPGSWRGTKATQTENRQGEQCLVSKNQPLPTLTQTPASQKRPGHLPPQQGGCGLEQPTTCLDKAPCLIYREIRQAAVHTRNWSIHATRPARATPLLPPAHPLLPHSPPSRCFPEQVAEADTREHHSAPVMSRVNSQHTLA